MRTTAHQPNKRHPRCPECISAVAILAVAATFLAVAGGLLLGATNASAHAGYDHSTPADGEVLAESPERVDVYFGQEMARTGGLPTLIVVNESGDTLSEPGTLDDDDRTHMSAELPPALPEGRYTVLWHTISDQDGEEAQGAFHFFIGEAPAQPTPTESGAATPESVQPSPAETAAPTPPPSEDGGSGGDVPVWALIAGLIGGGIVGVGIGIAYARRRSP
jgi:methionine-rich copper-binding protein CopC